jgi:hypothetical protein
MPRLRRWLAALAAACAVVTLGAWLLGGVHRGWTRTSHPVEKTDEVTGLTYREYERRFQPGVDFLAGGLLIAGCLAAVAGVIGRQPSGR